jgi:Putative Flp pilus-assembly TadE/G-like
VRALKSRFAQLNNQRGAAVALVAISLVAVMGMVVLVVDVGGLLTLRRRMVAASDAAALSAAQSCARNLTGEVLAQADQLAFDNVAQANRYFFEEEGCGAGRGKLTIGYRANQKLFFAPLLGVDDSSPVGHKSTAIWGPAQGGSSMPLKIDAGSGGGLAPCTLGADFPKECNIYFNNGGPSNQWGFVNLDQWGVDRDDNCSSSGNSNIRDWIDGGGVEKELESVPTYVCRTPGAHNNAWREGLEAKIGQSFVFPVNDPDEAGAKTFAIVGFTKLRIEGVLRGDSEEAVGSEAVAPQGGTCNENHTFTEDEVVPLWTITGNDCPSGTPPDTITNLKITKTIRGRTFVVPEGIAYTYDDVDQEITWHVPTWEDFPNLNNMDIEFDWSIPGVAATAGKCGTRPRDANAWCVVLVWEGPTIGGYEPCLECTEDFGIRAIRLAEADA